MVSGRSLVVSDIHGRIPVLERSLIDIADGYNPPELVIYVGDIVGSELLMKLQPIFYDLITKPTKALLKQNPNASDDDIISYPTGEGSLRVVDGCRQLNLLLGAIDPSYNTGVYCADIARELIKYIHYGHWCSNLPDKIIDALNQNMEADAEANYQIMKKFTDRGSQVFINEGNWDARRPIDFAKGSECIPLPLEKRSFSYKQFILNKNNPNIHYIDNQHLMVLDNVQVIFFPFDAIINYDGSPIPVDSRIKRKILIAHGHADFQAVRGNDPMGKEDQIIQDKMDLILDQLQPDLVIHGHLHKDTFHGNSGYITSKGIEVAYLPLGTCRTFDIH